MITEASLKKCLVFVNIGTNIDSKTEGEELFAPAPPLSPVAPPPIPFKIKKAYVISVKFYKKKFSLLCSGHRKEQK